MAIQKKQNKASESGVPLALRVRPELRTQIDQIAETNGLSTTDVANLCLAAGLNLVETKLKEIREPQPQAA